MKKTLENNIIKQVERDLKSELLREQTSFRSRFPLAYGLIGAFGASMLFAGVSGIVQSVQALKDNPMYMLVAGAVLLAATGTLYKKLG